MKCPSEIRKIKSPSKPQKQNNPTNQSISYLEENKEPGENLNLRVNSNRTSNQLSILIK
jgi:hypothetical protein